MRLHVRHTYPCPPETYWKLYWDPEFDQVLRRESKVERQLLEERRDGAILVRRLRFTPERELPGPVARLLGSSKLIYEQENRWDEAAGVLEWRVIPTILPGKLDARGKFTVRAAPGGCEQVVEGNITVSVPFLGGQIEKAVVGEVEKSYHRTAEVFRRWLEERGLAGEPPDGG